MSSLFLKFKFKFFQRYIANMIGAACNSRIPLATLQSVLNFVCVNNCSRDAALEEKDRILQTERKRLTASVTFLYL
jgi:hypothetical protein